MTLFPTNAFRHLHKKGLLRSYLESLGLEGDLQLSEALPRSVQKQLQEAGLAVEQSERPAVGLPFEIVQALNFELTYGCNLACTHCLQDGLRPPNRSISWADLASVQRALREAKMLGLATEGVNFTGGEILVKDSPVLTLVRLAASLDIHVRVNTNATWGKKEGICIGSEHFATDIDVVRTFKEAGAMILALSLDDRYSTYPGLLDKVIAVAAACEEVGLTYQVVMTDAKEDLQTDAMSRLTRAIGSAPRFLDGAQMEVVDIGGSKEWTNGPMKTSSLATLPYRSICERKGFYRPWRLHISPDGGIRGCMYAPGSGYFGNIRKDRLIDVLNRAASNPVARLFRNKGLEEFTEKYIDPWSELYRKIKHPCAASVLLARLSEKITAERERFGREPTADELESIHRTVAAEYRAERS
jgi:MoaA/NifB/PqqE/SkfB family radical SAM enzyme